MVRLYAQSKSSPPLLSHGIGAGGGGGDCRNSAGKRGWSASVPKGEKKIQKNATGHLDGETQTTTTDECARRREGRGKKKRGLIKSGEQTAAVESGDLPNLVLYPPKY